MRGNPRACVRLEHNEAVRMQAGSPLALERVHFTVRDKKEYLPLPEIEPMDTGDPSGRSHAPTIHIALT